MAIISELAMLALGTTINLLFLRSLKKIGEPYDDCGTTLQRFKIYTNVTNVDTKGLELHIYSNDTIGIEIRQPKEGTPASDKTVNECLLDNGKLNLKPFDIQKAKEGKPICTRDGREARIICWDSKGDECSLIVAVRSKTDEILEEVITYDKNGMHPANDESSPDNLMMDLEKRKLYVNIYKNKDGIYVSRVRDNSDIETLNLASSFLIGTICVTLEDNEIIGCNKSV